MKNRTPTPPAERPPLPPFTPVPRKPRHDGWTPERQRAFIEALADTGSVTRAAALDKLATELESLARDVRDSQLALGGTARRAVLAAYEIAKPLAKHDDAIRTKLAGALDFYSAPARQGAKTRAQKRSG